MARSCEAAVKCKARHQACIPTTRKLPAGELTCTVSGADMAGCTGQTRRPCTALSPRLRTLRPSGGGEARARAQRHESGP